MNSPAISIPPVPKKRRRLQHRRHPAGSGKISPENAERVLRMQKELGIRFGEAAQRLGLITEADIQQVLARQFDYPYLQAGEKRYDDRLLAAYQPFSPQVESLRAVRSQLMLRWFARGRNALTIIEVSPTDGGAIFAANLAVVFSQLGERTLLVDANLRQPGLHSVFDLPAGPGLSDMLAGRADLGHRQDRQLCLAVAAGRRHAAAEPAGTAEPLRFRRPQQLAVRRLRRGAVQRRPCALGADALALAARTGGVLLVARKNHTLLADISAVAEEVVHGGAEVVGAVMVDY
jgi:chain length determinant protein tyrosine kinase EpsG